MTPRTGLLAVALVVGGWLLGSAAATAVGAPPGSGGVLGLGAGSVLSAAVLRRPGRGGGVLFAAALAVALPLWAAIAFLLSIEVQTVLSGAETEHSPLAVALLLLLPALGAAGAAVRLRPVRGRRPPA